MSSIDKKTLDERVDTASIKKIDYAGTKRYSISSEFETASSDGGTTLNYEAYDPELQWTKEEEDRVRRIIDIRLMPFILLMSFVLNMDRTNVSNALSDYMPQDLGFDNDMYNVTIMVYSFVFTIFTLPSTTAAKRIGANIWIPILMSSWAIVTWAHALVKNYPQFMVIRILIAVTEGGFIPACLYYLTSWYKSNELGTRLAFFWGVQSFASAFSGLISFGIFRLRGVGGLEGWKWLFLIDGIFTHFVAFIAFLYLPRGPARTPGLLRGRKGWFDERQKKIAVTRLIRDDKSKTEQYSRVTFQDIKRVLLDTKVWMHLITTFVGFIPQTPISAYFPTIIRDGGFEVTTANLLTMPAYMVNLAFSILIAKSADKFGDVGLHAAFEAAWMLAGFIVLRTLPPDANRWSIYAGALIANGAPSWHGMHIAWMSSNVAPNGKRSLALGLIIGAANICSVPGAIIYQSRDAPKYYYGNTICIALTAVNLVGFLAIRTRYILTNRWREKKWNAMTEEEKKYYNETTKDEGSNRLDFRFRI